MMTRAASESGLTKQRDALIAATVIGLVLQLAMADGGHYLASIRQMFGLGGLGFSLLAGTLFACRCHPSWPTGISGGALAGGLCGALGIAWSVLLGDVPASLLVFGTLGSAAVGAAGGAVGKMLAGAMH